MRYLVTSEIFKPFYTNWFNLENHFTDGMIVYDLHKSIYTTDGTTWQIIEHDNL
jgi:hypothetical protein